MAPSGIPFVGLYGHLTSHTSNTVPPLSSSLSSSPVPTMTESSSSFSDSPSTSEQSYTDPVMMPPPGVTHYEARRARWLAPPPGWEPREPEPSTSRAKLEALLASENAIASEEVWNSSVRNVWKGLVGGGRLRKRLPLALVLKVLQAGWLRDGTWPATVDGSPLRATSPLPDHNNENEGNRVN